MGIGQLLALVVACVAAWGAGELLARFHVPRLPVYLAVGAVVGALYADARTGASLVFPKLQTAMLAFIGFVAGSHLVWKVIEPRVRSIAAQVVGMTIVVPLLVGVVVYVLTSELSTGARIAGALLAGSVMLALSPPEAIAVIGENASEGPFTRLVLGATVVMDVVVVALFSVTLLVAEGIVAGGTTAGDLVVSVVAVLGLGLLGGVVVGVVLRFVIERGWSDVIVGAVALLVAALAAVLAPALSDWAHEVLGLSIEIDSLLLAMVAGVIVANWTRRPERFEHVLHAMAPTIYVIFFTLTGLGLHLDAIVAAAGAAAALWTARLIGLFGSSRAAMTVVGEPAVVRRVAWRAYMPQAGIALALATTIATHFPQHGPQLSTVIIGTVVLNEASGPFFLRSALRAAGETATTRAEALD